MSQRMLNPRPVGRFAGRILKSRTGVEYEVQPNGSFRRTTQKTKTKKQRRQERRAHGRL